MPKIDNRNWISSIDSIAEAAVENSGTEAVHWVFRKYGATCAEDVSPRYYSSVFGELSFLAADN